MSRRRLIVSDIAPLPASETWVNVRNLGVIGDGLTDDTAALRAAIAEHRVLYFPTGWYNISDTLTLREDTVLIGLHPGAHRHQPAERHARVCRPGCPEGAHRGASRRGQHRLPGSASTRANATHARSRSRGRQAPDPSSMMSGSTADTARSSPVARTPDKGDRDHWNTQPASLLVTNGGGGVLKNIWTPNPHARSGLHISGTTTPGRLYAMSAEHHVDHEVIIENASDWRFFGLQFEAEREESATALPLKIDGARTCSSRIPSSTE
jgi:hypothetical protein